MRKWVLLWFVLASSVAAEVRFGAERAIAPPKIGYLGEFAFLGNPLVTAGDGQFLVTWTEWRPDYPAGLGKRSATLAMRVDLTGHPLDAHPIAVPVRAYAVVWTGNEWLVIGHEGVRIDRHGRIAGEPVPLFDTNFQFAFYSMPAVWTGSALIVAVPDYSGDRLFTRSFDAQLQFLEENVLLQVEAGGHVGGMATNGVTAILAFADSNFSADPRVAVFSRDGYLLRTLPLPPMIGYGAVTAGPDGYAAVGQLLTGPFRGLFLDANGYVRAETAPFAEGVAVNVPVLLWDGAQFKALYSTTSQMGKVEFHATTFDRNGTLSTTTVNLPPTNGRTFANIGRTTALAYSADWLLQVRVAPDVPSLATAATTAATPSPEPREMPAAAASAEHVLVGWRQRAEIFDALNVYVARVDRNGGPVDAEAVYVGANTCRGLPPAIASDGRDFLVAWRGNAFVQSAIVRRDGVPALPVNVARTGPCMEGGVSIASNGSQYLLTWSDIHSATKRLTIYAARVSANGTLLDAFPLKLGEITLATVKSTTVRVASDGNGYLVVWETSGVRVAADGTILDKKPLPLGEGAALGVWYNGRTYVVGLYEDGFTRRMRFRRLGSDGSGAHKFNEPPLAAYVLPAAYSKPALAPTCDAAGCVAWWNDSILRVADDGQAFAVSLEPTNVPSNPGAPGESDRVLVYASRLLLIQARSVFELPYSRATEIFVQAAGGGKARVLRH